MKNMRASIAGEVIPHHDFYSYKAKYLDENGAGLVIPADIPETALQNIQKTAIKNMSDTGMRRNVPSGFFLKKRRKHCVKRDQHYSGVHQDQHVPQALGGERSFVPRPYRYAFATRN
jgi:D-alanine-D-alanine ligase-like ATP-grasp enzyme